MESKYFTLIKLLHTIKEFPLKKRNINYTDIKSLTIFNDLMSDGLGEELLEEYDKLILPFFLSLNGRDNLVSTLYEDGTDARKELIAMKNGLKNVSDENIIKFVDTYILNSEAYSVDSIPSTHLDDTKIGFKKVRCIKNGKATICQKRQKGFTRRKKMSFKQKMALKKAVLKAHSGVANMKRKKSFNMGSRLGTHKR